MKNATSFAPDRRLDVICLGRFAVDFYAQQIGARRGGCHELRQVSGRLVGQHGIRVRAARAQGGPHFARRQRRPRPLSRGDHRARRLRRQPRQRRPRAPHRRPWCWGSRTRTRSRSSSCARTARTWRLPRTTSAESYIAQSRALLITGTHFSTDYINRISNLALDRARRNNVRTVHRHRLQAGALGAHRARRRRDTLYALRQRHRAPADDPAQDRPRDRDDRGIQHCRRQHRHHGIAAGGARGDEGDPRRQARRAGLRGDRRARFRPRSTTRTTAKAWKSKC